MSVGAKTILLTLLAAAAVYFAGNARVQLWDRDEPRYAECSRQMLESGDWVVPRLYDKLRYQKPPLIYWCQASAMKVFGKEGDAGVFAARVPSALAMLLTLIVLAVVLSRYVGVEQAAWTVFIFATSGMTIMAAKVCLTDSVLILFITAAQLCVYAIWRGNRSWGVAVLLAVMCGLGMLTKGPFILGICGCTAAALGLFHLVGRWWHGRPAHAEVGPSTSVESASRTMSFPQQKTVRDADPTGTAEVGASDPVGSAPRTINSPHEETVHDADPTEIRNLKSGKSKPWITIAQIAIGTAIVAAIVLPWVLLVRHRAPDFLPMMFHEGKQHALEGKEGHHFPPGYHLLLVLPMFMPWSLLLPMAIGIGIRNRKVPAVRFALAAVLGPWLMVEFIGTKLPHYFLPAYPAMAFLVAFAIRDCLHRDSKEVESKAFLAGATVWALAIILVGAAPWLALGPIRLPIIGNVGSAFRPLPWGAMIGLSALALFFSVSVFILLKTRRFAPAFVTMGAGMFAAILLASSLYFPDAEFLRTSARVAAILREQGAIHPGDVKMVDYKEPSLAFYQGGTIREVERKADLLSKPLKEWPRDVVITREVWDMIPDRDRKFLRVVGSCHGLAYSDTARVVDVMVIENSLYSGF